MNRNRSLLIGILLIMFMFVGCSGTKSTVLSNNMGSDNILSKTFTPGDHNVSIMQVALPTGEAERINEISLRFQKSIQQNQQWFNDYVSQFSNSEDKLPWDEKFGITKEEFEEMISSVERMSLMEVKKTTITLVKESDGTITLKSNADLPYLSGIKIDISNNRITNTNGVFKFNDTIEASDEQKLTGRWSGDSWRLYFDQLTDPINIDNSKTYGAIDISVGQLEKTKQMMVYYKERVIDRGNSLKGEEIIIFNN